MTEPITALTEPTPPVDINQQAIDALSAINAVPVVIIITPDGTALSAERNIMLQPGWCFAVGYVEKPKQ